MDFSEFLRAELAAIEAAGLRRRLRTMDSPQGAAIDCDGRRVANFSSNDYLGLAEDPRLREAATAAIERCGVGAGASRLISGNHSEHEALEAALAAFKRCEAVLSFSTGYAAAVGTIPALVGANDVVVLDKLCHASLVDGARLSGAVVRVFPHNRLGKLESHLRWARDRHPSARILVVAESVYSMDGDVAPLAEIVALKDAFGAWLMLDEAHGVGVLGSHGRGLVDATDLADRVEVQMGTLGKALGASGAYIGGSAALRDVLINKARSFIFSTAPPPAVAAAARAGVEILQSSDGAHFVSRLRANIERLAAARGVEPSPSAIVPILIGDERRAVEVANDLLAAGMWVPAVRYPTVARGAARLRVTLSAAHGPDQIALLARHLAALV